MNKINLTQVTAFVVAVSTASFFANAELLSSNSIENSTVEQSDNLTRLEVNEVIEHVDASTEKFTFTSLDSDHNGKLSQEEVAVGENEWLTKAFNQIDGNADEYLTEQELVDFTTGMATTETE